MQGADDKNNLIIIDFEYSAYNYRGFDLANHFCETIYDYTNEEFPYFWAKPENYPTKEKQVSLNTLHHGITILNQKKISFTIRL